MQSIGRLSLSDQGEDAVSGRREQPDVIPFTFERLEAWDSKGSQVVVVDASGQKSQGIVVSETPAYVEIETPESRGGGVKRIYRPDSVTFLWNTFESRRLAERPRYSLTIADVIGEAVVDYAMRDLEWSPLYVVDFLGDQGADSDLSIQLQGCIENNAQKLNGINAKLVTGRFEYGGGGRRGSVIGMEGMRSMMVAAQPMGREPGALDASRTIDQQRFYDTTIDGILPKGRTCTVLGRKVVQSLRVYLCDIESYTNGASLTVSYGQRLKAPFFMPHGSGTALRSVPSEGVDVLPLGTFATPRDYEEGEALDVMLGKTSRVRFHSDMTEEREYTASTEVVTRTYATHVWNDTDDTIRLYVHTRKSSYPVFFPYLEPDNESSAIYPDWIVWRLDIPPKTDEPGDIVYQITKPRDPR